MPIIGEEEVEAVSNVLRKGPLTNALGIGPKVTAFESKFAKFVDATCAIAVNTGTSALQLALISAGIKQGDEVILPSFTFVATAEAVIMAGGIPVFVDIDPNTFNINPEKIEEKITSKTKAILPVDLFGLPANLKPIRKIAQSRDLSIIEDAAQAHGAKYFEKSVGFLSDVTCWSFYASKNMTTGEGGMITTNNSEIANKIKILRTHGEKIKYSSITLGYNYRMSEIQAAIGLVQLSKLPNFIEKRTKNAKRLTKFLLNETNLALPYYSKNMISSWNLFTVKIKNSTEKERNNVVNQLRKKGIGASIYYVNPIHMMPYYKEKFGIFNLPETEKTAKQVFSLPIHPGIEDYQIEYIAKTLSKIL
jgi:dTDP-4-amino-4,6-dideoxygalactose transaminase